MQSSRVAFSSLQTQQGFTFAAASPAGLRSQARLEGGAGVAGVAASAGAELNQPILLAVDGLGALAQKVMRNPKAGDDAAKPSASRVMPL